MIDEVSGLKRISNVELREVMAMKHKIKKAWVSKLIESPFYFALPVKARYFLLSRLVGQLQSVLKKDDDRKGISDRSMETDIT